MPAPVAQPKTLYDKIWDDHVMYVHFAASCVFAEQMLTVMVALLQ